MNKLLRLKALLMRLSDNKTLGVIGEDLRKVAATSIGVGIVGLAVSGDTITTGEAGHVVDRRSLSMVLWYYSNQSI